VQRPRNMRREHPVVIDPIAVEKRCSAPAALPGATAGAAAATLARSVITTAVSDAGHDTCNRLLGGKRGHAPAMKFTLAAIASRRALRLSGRARLPKFDPTMKARDMQKSCSVALGAKTYYRPIEAALRWVDLLRHEQQILETLGPRAFPDPGEFPRWPKLHLYADRIFDGIAHGELACGKSGIVRKTVRVKLNDPALTIRHVDLKSWVARYYPGDKPHFLFDEIERALHPSVNSQALSVLLVEREATKVELAALKHTHETLRVAHDACVKRTRPHPSGLRSESTYLNIIGGLLALLLGKSPSGAAYSSFRNTDAVVSALLAHHPGRQGMSERTLWAKFGQARRHLATSG